MTRAAGVLLAAAILLASATPARAASGADVAARPAPASQATALAPDTVPATEGSLPAPAGERMRAAEAMDRYLSLDALAEGRVDAVTTIEARALADAAEELLAWGETSVALDLLDEAIALFAEAGIAPAAAAPPDGVRPAPATTSETP